MVNIIGTTGDDSLVGSNAENNTIDGLAGNDTIIGGDLTDTLDGGEGNDRIFSNVIFVNDLDVRRGFNRGASRSGGSDLIDGGAGNDLIVSIVGDSNPILKGGDGDDTLDANRTTFPKGTGSAEIDGGEGFDLLRRYEAPSRADINDPSIRNESPVTIDLDRVDFSVLPLPYYIKSIRNVEGVQDFYGGVGNDTVTVSGSSTIGRVIDGGGGDDNLNGGNGDDTIIGSPFQGSDTLNGGAGDDVFYGENNANNIIDGGEGFDYLGRYESTTSISIDLNNVDFNTLPLSIIKSIRNVEGIRDFFGSAGNDTVTAGSDTSTVNRIIDGGDGNDSIISGNGNDTIYSGSGNDIVSSGNGNDIIDISFAAPGFTGDGTGNDTIDGGDGDDTIGGGGRPKTSTSSVPVNGGQNKISGGAGNDRIDCTVCSFDKIDGGSGNDSINGGFQDTIDGGDGDDTIIGGGESSSDSISGGCGNDLIRTVSQKCTISGGDGDDTISSTVNNFGSQFSSTIYGGSGNDIIDGGTPIEDTSSNFFASVDVIYGGDGNDRIYGRGANDNINGDGGDDFAYGGSGDDLMLGGDGIDNFEGNIGNDTILGESGDDGLAGQEGDDSLVGGDGNDRLYGWLGNDILTGNDDSDTLYGGSGSDQLTGGSEADTFNFGSDFVTGDAFSSLGLDTITDFQSGVDKIQLQRSAFAALPPALSFATVSDDGLAASSSEAIVYSLGTGTLFYNTDGAINGFGEGGAFAKLTGNPAIAVSDFDLLPGN
jgi:Ca2+-binding RTX toxin-like protein